MRVPVATKALVATVVALSVASGLFRLVTMAREVQEGGESDRFPNHDPYLLLLAVGKTPGWALWTLLTTTFVETHLLPFLVAILMLWTGGRYCNQIWSSREYIKFVLWVSLPCNLAQLIIYSMFPKIDLETKDPHVYYIYGLGSIMAGLTVALKQQIPEHRIILFVGKINFRIRWLPVILLVSTTVARVCGLYQENLSCVLGFYAAWFYLRYYQTLPEGGNSRLWLLSRPKIQGDASDSFGFAHFFPQPLSLWLEPVTSAADALATRMYIIPAFSVEDIESANQRYASRLSGNILPSHGEGVRSTNERRKQMLEVLAS